MEWKQMIKIGDFSKLARISIRMLRHYDEIGLLIPCYVDQFTSYRFYSAEQLTTVGRIQTLKEMGFALAVIKEILLTYDDVDSLRNYLKIQLDQAREDAIAAEHRLHLLENMFNRTGDESYMQYTVTVKEIPKRYVASLRRIVPSYNDERLLWEQMGSETKALQMSMANPAYSLAMFYDEGYKESDVDVEIQVAVNGSFNDTENVRFKTVPAVTVASSVFKGGYDQLIAVNEAIASWVADNNYSFDGTMFLIYHVSPGHDPNPANWVTEVCYPVRK